MKKPKPSLYERHQYSYWSRKKYKYHLSFFCVATFLYVTVLVGGIIGAYIAAEEHNKILDNIFSGIVPLTIAIGFAFAYWQSAIAKRRQTFELVSKEVNRLITGKEERDTLSMMTFELCPTFLDTETDMTTYTNQKGDKGYRVLPPKSKIDEKSLYNIDLLEVCFALISHKEGIWKELSGGDYGPITRFETLLIVLANLSKQMRREHVEVKDVPELCTWIEMLLPTGITSRQRKVNAIRCLCIWDFIERKRISLLPPLIWLVEGYHELDIDNQKIFYKTGYDEGERDRSPKDWFLDLEENRELLEGYLRNLANIRFHKLYDFWYQNFTQAIEDNVIEIDNVVKIMSNNPQYMSLYGGDGIESFIKDLLYDIKDKNVVGVKQVAVVKEQHVRTFWGKFRYHWRKCRRKPKITVGKKPEL